MSHPKSRRRDKSVSLSPENGVSRFHHQGAELIRLKLVKGDQGAAAK
jgi:hypothetical protein